MKNLTYLFAVAAIATLYSCGTTDVVLPGICNNEEMHELEREAGTTDTLIFSLCDDVELSEVRYDLHSAEGHSHNHEGEEGEEEEHILYSGSGWAQLETRMIEGVNVEDTLILSYPDSVRGIWDLVVSVVDEAGNTAEDEVILIHIENDIIPLFTLETDVDEVHWHGGDVHTIDGAVMDSDGVSSAELHIIRESDESVVWSYDIMPNGADSTGFSVEITVPSEEGEYHFEMEAADAAGNSMHTGFHMDVHVD